MIKGICESLGSNFFNRVRNPILGTFTLVLILKNWKIFYSLFIFDEGISRISKIETIEQYIANSGGILRIIGCSIICTLAVLGSMYALLAAGELLSNFYHSTVKTFCIKWATKGQKVVLKETHENLEKEYNNTIDKLSEERGKRKSAEESRDNAEKEKFESIDKQKKETRGLNVQVRSLDNALAEANTKAEAADANKNAANARKLELENENKNLLKELNTTKENLKNAEEKAATYENQTEKLKQLKTDINKEINEKNLLLKYLKEEKIKEKLILCSKIIESQKEDSFMYNIRGLMKLELMDNNGSTRDFDKAILLNPNYAEAYANRAKAKLKIRDDAGAIRDCNDALLRDTKLHSAYFYRAKAKVALNKLDDALLDIDGAMKITSRISSYYYFRSSIYKRLETISRDTNKKNAYKKLALEDEKKAMSLAFRE
ncbi:MAG: hypothetical protein R3Y46_07360 [Opitutales bacterium]